MNSSKNRMWIIPFKKFSRLRVKVCKALTDQIHLKTFQKVFGHVVFSYF